MRRNLRASIRNCLRFTSRLYGILDLPSESTFPTWDTEMVDYWDTPISGLADRSMAV